MILCNPIGYADENTVTLSFKDFGEPAISKGTKAVWLQEGIVNNAPPSPNKPACSSSWIAVGSKSMPLGHIVADPVPPLPPESSSSDPQREAMVARAELLAKALDTTVKIPGIPFYLGLDPLLGLIPGVGDMLSNLIGTVILVLAARLQVPQIVIARMSLNLLINGTVGAIPIVGDLFSIWFRSHAKNAELLRRAATQPYRETQQARLYVAGIIGGTVVLLLLAITAVLWIGLKIWTTMVL